jgi:uncharacterized surface protein with fasciclin (FAS1) repeats
MTKTPLLPLLRRASVLALAVVVTSSASAAVLRLRAELLATNEVPANASTATGRAIVFYDTDTKRYTATVSVSGLSSALTGSHIHDGVAGANGPVVIDFGGAAAYANTGPGGFYSGTFSGTYTADVGKLLAAGAYVNVHTTTNPGGEIRGQLVLETTSNERLLNYSARGFVNPGNGRAGTLFGGFVIGGAGGPKKVLLRSLGESLELFGLNNGLKDTSIFVFDGASRLIASNDNWREDGQENAIRATGLAPSRDSDAGLILELPVGSYTVQVDSEKGAGIAVLEVYGLDNASPLATLQASGRFTKFLAAVSAAGLDATLNGPGPFTLFVPTDAAFTPAVQTALDAMTKPKLIELLQHHVTAANLSSSQIATGTLTMLFGTNPVTKTAAGVTVGGAKVVEADITTTNGTIHVIDQVLVLP